MGIFKQIKQKSGFLIAIVLATAVGGAATAIVNAAIPNSQTGQINSCYTKSKGTLRVVDAEAGQSCTTQESPLSWAVGRASSAYVALNDDGTINPSYTKGVTSVKIVNTTTPTSQPPDGYKVCFNLPQTPIWATTNQGGGVFLSISNFATERDAIIQTCGNGYNALDDNQRGFVEDGGQPKSNLRWVFFY